MSNLLLSDDVSCPHKQISPVNLTNNFCCLQLLLTSNIYGLLDENTPFFRLQNTHCYHENYESICREHIRWHPCPSTLVIGENIFEAHVPIFEAEKIIIPRSFLQNEHFCTYNFVFFKKHATLDMCVWDIWIFGYYTYGHEEYALEYKGSYNHNHTITR
jgi:hypothetical protein